MLEQSTCNCGLENMRVKYNARQGIVQISFELHGFLQIGYARCEIGRNKCGAECAFVMIRGELKKINIYPRDTPPLSLSLFFFLTRHEFDMIL